LIEFSDKILLVGKKTACFMKHFGIGLGHGAGRASTKVKMVVDGILRSDGSLCSDPMGYVKSINQTVLDAGGCLIEACASAVKDPSRAWGAIKDLATDFEERFHEASWDVVAEASGAFIGETLTLLAAVVGPASKVRAGVGLARTFASLARAEIVATAALVAKSPGFQNILQPLATSCREAALFCTSGVRSPVQFARRIATLRSIPGKDARRAFMRVCGCLGKSNPGAPQFFKEALEKFASTPGFSNRADAIVGRIARANPGGVESAVKGAYYEAKVGLEIAKACETTGEIVEQFGFRACVKNVVGGCETSLRDFDVLTNRRLIECKNCLWTAKNIEKVQRAFGDTQKIARQIGKELWLFSKSAIPEDLKHWLIARGINFFEG
jgi:hypothetical protein